MNDEKMPSDLAWTNEGLIRWSVDIVRLLSSRQIAKEAEKTALADCEVFEQV